MKKSITLLLLFFTLFFSNVVNAQEPMLGEIKMFAGNFAPRGWALCNGQTLQISQHTALFSILGTTYGGDGKTTFALPDLRGRVPIGTGQGQDLSSKRLGQNDGSERTVISINNLPSHSHTIKAVAEVGDEGIPNGHLLASTSIGDKNYSSLSTNATMNKSMVGNTGNSQPINIMQPSLSINFIIALDGVFPSRN